MRTMTFRIISLESANQKSFAKAMPERLLKEH
jgi:hypothetical protein